MDWNMVATGVSSWGPAGILIVVVLWQNHKITNRLFTVIEHNTQVMTRLIEIIERKVERRRE